MQRVFMDTSAFIALLDPRDDLHAQAVQIQQSLSSQAAHLVTTNFVLDETYTGLRGKIQHNAILRFRDSVRQSQQLSVVRITEAVEEGRHQRGDGDQGPFDAGGTSGQDL